MKKKLYYLVTVIALAGVVWLGNINKIKQNEQVYPVAIDIVSVSDTINTSIQVNGRIAVKEELIEYLRLPFGGLVKEVLIRENAYIEKGTPLLVIQQHPTDVFKDKHTVLKAEIQNLEIAVLKEKHNRDVKYRQDLDTMKFNYEKLLSDSEVNMKEIELLTKQKAYLPAYEYETKLLQLKQEQKEIEHSLERIRIELEYTQGIGLEEVKRAYESQYNNLKKAKEDLLLLEERQNYLVKAGSSGFVLFSKPLFKGQVINPHETLLRIMDLKNPDIIFVRARLIDFEFNRVNVGDRAKIYLTSLSGEAIEGKIRQRPVVAKDDGEVTYYDLEISLEAAEISGDLVVNMPVEVIIDSKISIPEMSSVYKGEGLYYTIPVTAVVNRNNKNAVFIYDQGEGDRSPLAKLAYVNVVFSDNERVIVKCNDFNRDTMVITTGNYLLHGGERVRLEQEIRGGTLDLNLF